MVILLADDDVVFLRAFSELLGTYLDNKTILTADSARKAIEMLRAAVIDLVVMDVRMQDDLDLVKRIKKNYKRTSVIFISNRDVEKAVQELKESGISCFLRKHHEVTASAGSIRRVLDSLR